MHVAGQSVYQTLRQRKAGLAVEVDVCSVQRQGYMSMTPFLQDSSLLVPQFPPVYSRTYSGHLTGCDEMS
jgi:hypothetical protein